MFLKKIYIIFLAQSYIIYLLKVILHPHNVGNIQLFFFQQIFISEIFRKYLEVFQNKSQFPLFLQFYLGRSHH